MSETRPIADVAVKISSEIFKVFHWELHPKKDSNFDCVHEDHKTESGKKKLTHPEDVVFHYLDPYLNKRVYLHTDLKSYAANTIQPGKVRHALRSLAETVECAAISESWQTKFAVNKKEDYEIRGLLFLANHDGQAVGRLGEIMQSISKVALPVAKSQAIHVLSPEKITDLFAVASDIKLSLDDTISKRYWFHYPDLTLWKRQVVESAKTPATIEALMSPFFILKHDSIKKDEGFVHPGSIVYYARAGKTVEEFVYLLDALLRHQLVLDKERVQIRVFCRDASEDIFSNFDQAKHKYCSAWGFHADREQEIMDISLNLVSRLSANYSPAKMGWDE